MIWVHYSLVPRPFPPPVFDRVYSMQIRRGKAWEIWSRVVTSGRQMVDTYTRGAVPDSSNCLFVSNRTWRYERRMVLTLPC